MGDITNTFTFLVLLFTWGSIKIMRSFGGLLFPPFFLFLFCKCILLLSPWKATTSSSVCHISLSILIWHHHLFFFSSPSTSRQTALGWAKIHKCFRKSLEHRPIPRGTNGLMSRSYGYVIWWLNFCCDWSDSNEYSQQVGSPEGGGTRLTGAGAQTGVLDTPTHGQLAADDQSGVFFWTNNHNNIKPH